MGSPKKSNQTKTIKTVGQYFNKKIAAFLVVITAAVGVYFMFFASAAVNNCSAVKGGNVCDINQAQSDQDATWSVGPGVQNLITNSGWKDLGVPFRAPTFAYNGAVPVTRFFRKDITAHNLVPNTNPLHKTYKADSAHYLDEGVLFYAWPDGREPGTVPIYSADRKALWFYKVFTDNKNIHNQYLNSADKSWQDGGILFWAYPANWYPPIHSAPTAKNAGCPNANLKQGDRGSCVQALKTTLNSYGATPKIDANNDLFDDLTHRNVIYYLGKLQARGVKVENYTTTVTPGIWQAFANGYPPVAATAKTPAKPAVVPVKTNAKPSDKSKPVKESAAKSEKVDTTKLDCNKLVDSKTDFCKKIMKEYLEIVRNNKKRDDQKKKDIEVFWLKYNLAAANQKNADLEVKLKTQNKQNKVTAKTGSVKHVAAKKPVAKKPAVNTPNVREGSANNIQRIKNVDYAIGCEFTYFANVNGRAKRSTANIQYFSKYEVKIQDAKSKCTAKLKSWRSKNFKKAGGEKWDYKNAKGKGYYNFHSEVIN